MGGGRDELEGWADEEWAYEIKRHVDQRWEGLQTSWQRSRPLKSVRQNDRLPLVFFRPPLAHTHGWLSNNLVFRLKKNPIDLLYSFS